MLDVLLFYRFPENSCYLMDKVVLLRLKFVNCLLDYEKLLDIEGKIFCSINIKEHPKSQKLFIDKWDDYTFLY